MDETKVFSAMELLHQQQMELQMKINTIRLTKKLLYLTDDEITKAKNLAKEAQIKVQAQ